MWVSWSHVRAGLVMVMVMGCAPAIATPSSAANARPGPGQAGASPRYDAPSGWLCRPDLPLDPCHADLSSVELGPDGSRRTVEHVPAVAPVVDCFYVYPTVDLGVVPGNHTDFHDLEPMRSVTLAQAARFNEVCALYVPLYRQITISTYLLGDLGREPYLATAFSDVALAFEYFLAHHDGTRKIALIGHSQGADMVVRLLTRYFDGDPAMRERLLVAMPIGWHVEVPKGQRTGGTFANLPVCAREDESGCIIAYRSYRDARFPSVHAMDLPSPGHETVCVNPASATSDAPHRFSRMYVPRARLFGSELEGSEPPFLLLRDLYSGRCVEGPHGFRYLAISEAPAPGDVRKSPLPLENWRFNMKLGMHALDFQFPQGDLIDLVAKKTAHAM